MNFSQRRSCVSSLSFPILRASNLASLDMFVCCGFFQSFSTDTICGKFLGFIQLLRKFETSYLMGHVFCSCDYTLCAKNFQYCQSRVFNDFVLSIGTIVSPQSEVGSGGFGEISLVADSVTFTHVLWS